MNGRGIAVAGLAGMLAMPAVSMAEGHAVGARVGALGLGVEYTYTLNDRIAFRGGINGSKFGFDEVESGIDYDFDLIWDSVSAGVDFHPTRKAFRLSAGILKNDNRLEASSRLANSVDVGGTIYTPAEVGTLRAFVGFEDSVAPFVGIGWDWSRNAERVGFVLDLGIVDQGSPVVRLNASGTLLGDPIFESDLAAEQLELQQSLDDFDVLPYISIGVNFKF